MAYPDNLLARDERVVLRKHPHWKVLILPTVAFVVIVAGAFVLARILRNWEYHRIAWIAIAAVAVLLLVLLTLVPVIKWRTEHFVVTTAHVFFRSGVFRRREHQIPLGYVQNIETSIPFWGRILGYGTLTLESGADQPLDFDNVASIARVQSTINQLIADDRRGAPAAREPRGGTGDGRDAGGYGGAEPATETGSGYGGGYGHGEGEGGYGGAPTRGYQREERTRVTGERDHR